jgi:uncharacterized protein DUF4403
LPKDIVKAKFTAPLRVEARLPPALHERQRRRPVQRLGAVTTALVPVLLIACLGACGGGSDKPAAPEEIDVAPPPPARVSRFSAPLDYDFTTVLAAVDHAVPRTFGSMDSVKTVGDDSHRHYAYAATRGPFDAFAVGPIVHLRSTLAYTARGFFKPIVGPTISAGCGGGDEKPRIRVELSTPLTLRENWHLSSHAALVRIAPASNEARDHCDVTILHYDVTGRVVDAARSGILAHLSDIDRRIADVDLRDRFDSWWGTLAKPIRLTDGLWLQLRPRRLSIGKVSGHEHVLTIPVTLEASPEIVTSDSEPATDTIPLPPLGRDTTAEGFHISLDGVIDYAAASEALGNALMGKTVTEAGRTINVTTITVAPTSKGRLSLAVNFTGDANGMLRFTGKPVYDSTTRTIAVPDLDYDLATDDGLIRMYSWLRSDSMRDTFRKKAHVSAQPALAKGRALLLAGLNRQIGDALTLRARVDTVGVTGLYVTRSGIIVRADARGSASVAVKFK